MSVCLYCPIRIAMSKHQKQTPHLAEGVRGLCPVCNVAVNKLIRSGRYTEAQIIERGWKLPATEEGRTKRRRWNGQGFKEKYV